MKEKTQKKPGAKRGMWRGLTTVTASLLTLTVTATGVVGAYRTDIDKFLGTQSSKIVTGDASAEELYTYKSDYKSTKELLTSISDLGERMSAEGSVLLKNNGALPLSKAETQKLSLLGYTSYFPIQGGDMGSSLAENKGTDADTVDMVGAFTAKGFKINKTVQDLYTGLKESYKSSTVMPWGQTIDFYHATAPGIGKTFNSLEPSQTVLDQASANWKDSLKDNNVMLVTIGRSGGENEDYQVGENGVSQDQKLNQTDALGLSDTERDLIKTAVAAKKANQGKVVVLLNNANPMEIQELADNADIDAILQVGLPGGYGFYGVADILDGEVSPSGHLTDTYAVNNAASPAAQNYGDYEYTNADPANMINSELVNAEDIYTGYKYYETRYADSVLGQGNAASNAGSSNSGNWSYAGEVTYPFGYGLSYTTFTQTLDDVKVDLKAKTVTATVTVTNTGKTAGKDVAQLYVSTPYTDYDQKNKVEKSAVQLIGYEKTDLLDPGASQKLTVTADAEDMASWDSSFANASGTKGDYILDAGTYSFSIGNGAHEAVNNILASAGKTMTDGMTAEGNAQNVKTWNLDQMDSTTFATTENGTAVENQMADADLNYYMPDTVTYLSRSDWSGTWPKTYQNLTATDQMLDVMKNGTYTIQAQGDPTSVTFNAKNHMTLADLKGVTDITDEKWTKLMDQISLEECMIRTAFGGTSTKTIDSIVSPEAIQNDGPNGFNSYTLGQYANTDKSSGDPYAIDPQDKNLNYKMGVMSNQTVIAQTFSKALATEYGKVLGNYSIWSNCAILWGIGMNIHRLPYNGRNFEYYSEDPVLAGEQGAASITAAKQYGLILAPKHVAFNCTETNRTGICTFLNEQTAREGELRTLQKCIEKAGALGLMTAYNRVGCTADNAYSGILMNIVRKEWGFKGLASEDFIQDVNYAFLPAAVHSGVTMTCNTGTNSMDAVSAKWKYWTVKNVGQDATLMQDLKNCMLWQNYALANSNAMDGLSTSSAIVTVRTWYDNALLAAIIVFALLTLGCLYGYSASTRRQKKEGGENK